jgi:hypothetical protein
VACTIKLITAIIYALVDQNKSSSILKIFCTQIYNNNDLQNMSTTIIKSGIKNTKPKRKLGLLKSPCIFIIK